MSIMVWQKPVVSIFRERTSIDRESDPFVVVRARQVSLTEVEDHTFRGTVDDFFTLMGDVDYVSSAAGKGDHYVFCWFDDSEPDMTKDLRRLRGVRFEGEVSCVENEKTHKRTYNAAFTATQAKIK